MANIPQRELFVFNDLNILGDLERLKVVLDNLPDKELMHHLEQKRNNGRNDYPIRAIWNSIIAAIIFEHHSIESLRRELSRNGQLRQICGFDHFSGIKAVPTASAYSRFIRLLQTSKVRTIIKEMFHNIVHQCYEELPGFGENLGVDGKSIESFAKKTGTIPGDRRGEHDANWGKHSFFMQSSLNKIEKVVKKWFGFNVHLIADTNYELPVAFTVTRASRSEVKTLHKMLNILPHENAEILETCKQFTADRGYDDVKLINKLWNNHSIKPVVDIRNLWKDGEETKLVPGESNIVYDYKGTVSCICMKTGKQREMGFAGFEKDRESLKYRCPAKHYGLTCESVNSCPVKNTIRIKRAIDPRVFTPIARSSYKWKKNYNKRTSLERINSRIDRNLGFELHTIRGKNKMTVLLTIGFLIMLSTALGRFRQNRPDLMRSLVKRA